MKRRRRRAKRKLNLHRFFFFIIGLIILCTACVGCELVYSSVKGMPELNPASLQSAASTMIYDKDGNLITQLGIKNSDPIDLKDVPDNVKNAFLAIEDPAFYQHPGVSIRGIARAAWTNLRSGSIREGGSTITQQLVKEAYLTTEQTYRRKIQEALLSFQVERKYTKDEILELYLNNIYLGEGAYGIQAASRTFLGKDIKTDPIALEEAALLAGLPQAPSAYSPYSNPEAAVARRNDVLDSMARNNYISTGEAEEAKNRELIIDTKEPAEKAYPYPYFMDYVTDELAERYGESEIFKGGLRVYTTLDPNIQKITEAAMANNANFPASTTNAAGLLQPQGAVVVLDPQTGYIKALVGGREHKQKRQWNRVVHTNRQPGSAFKPIAAYGPAIEYHGLGPASVVDDIPTSYGSYSPRNDDGRFRGLVTLRSALTSSVNIVAVKLLVDTVGMQDSIKFASSLGIELAPQSHGPSMALGGLYHGVSPLQMAGAYAAFANQGIYTEPIVITKVEKADGVILEQAVPKQHQAMKASTAYLITDMLKSAMSSGTGTGAQIGRAAAGKTGTTDDGKDIWFVGYTPDLVTAVWIGYDNPTAMPHAYGGTYPARIWREVMSKSLSNVTAKSFTQPAGIVSATVDNKSGLLPGPNTPQDSQVTDIFAEGTIPTESDNSHVFVEVCATSGQLPTSSCPDRIIKTLVQLPYSVPSTVGDYNLRVPEESCTVHGSGAESGNDRPINPAIMPGSFESEADDQQSNRTSSYSTDDSAHVAVDE